MATSSIIENIRVNNPQLLREYVAAMEASADKPLRSRSEEEKSGVVTDPDRISGFMKKALAKKGITT